MDDEYIDKAIADAQNGYYVAKRDQEAHEDTFRYFRKWYTPMQIFRRSGISYNDLLDIKKQYEAEFEAELSELLKIKLRDREYGEPMNMDFAFDYLQLPYKSMIGFKRLLKNGKVPVIHTQTLIKFINENCILTD